MPRKREFPTANIEGKSVSPSPIPHSLGEDVNNALERLTEADQDVLRAYFMERQSYSEMAREAGLAGRQGAASRVKFALERLKLELAKDGIDYE